jgi:hypothetical protein
MSLLDKAWSQTAAAVSNQFADEYHHNPELVVCSLTDNRIELRLPKHHNLQVLFLLKLCDQYGLDAQIDLSHPTSIKVQLGIDSGEENPTRVELLLNRASTHEPEEITRLMEMFDLSSRADARNVLNVSKLCNFKFDSTNLDFPDYNPVAERVLQYTGQLQLTLNNFRYLYHCMSVNSAVLYPGVVAIGILRESSSNLSMYGQRQERLRSAPGPHGLATTSRKRPIEHTSGQSRSKKTRTCTPPPG